MARRLVLTAGALLERRPATYEVAERRQLAALAALVRSSPLAGLDMVKGYGACKSVRIDAPMHVASDVSSRRPCQCACGARRGSDEAGAGRRARRPQKRAGAAGAQVCFAAEPTWLAFEWTDGAPAAMYITPHRDALAAAVLDAAQARRRPIARAPRPSAWLTSSVAGSLSLRLSAGPR